MNKTISLSANKKLNFFLSFVFVVAPLITVVVFQLYYSFFYTEPFTFFTFSPRWSDEIAHYRTTKAILEYGEPLGYYGYNGSHATFGSCVWPAVRECGYVLYGLCFGFRFFSPWIANVLFLCFANLIFALLTKPSIKQLTMLSLFSLTSYCYLFFSSTCMSECFFYALAIVICGLLFRLHRHPTGVIYRYCLTPLFILFSAFVCTPFAIFMFAYGVIIFKQMPLLKNFLLSASITAVSVVLAYIFFKLHFSPYPSNWSIPFSDGHLVALRSFWSEQFIHLFKLHTPIFAYSCIVFLLLSVFCLIVFLCMAKKKDARLSEILCVAILLYGFFAALFIMYPTESLWRSLLIMLVFTIYALILILPEKKTLCIILCIAVIGSVLGFSDCLNNISCHDAAKNDRTVYAEEEKALYEKWIQIDPTQSKWQNTVISFNTDSLFLPSGTGINVIIHQIEKFPTEAGYALVDVTLSEYNDICILLTKAGFVEVHKDDVRAIYVNSLYQ